jgi:hypothetical protein
LIGQVNVTQEEYEKIALTQLTELWTEFGDLTEIWFDGGYLSDIGEKLRELLLEFQPHALGQNGGGLMPHIARWVGTEGDMTGLDYPAGVWSTYCCNTTNAQGACVVAHSGECSLNTGPYGGAGCPSSVPGCSTYYPASVDYTLMAGDHWFWMPGTTMRPLKELIDNYHNSVGRNTVMELAFSPDRTGRIAPDHAARYANFGRWIKSCYGTAVARTSKDFRFDNVVGRKKFVVSLKVQKPVDRVVIQEDMRFGQRILSFALMQEDAGSGVPSFLATGQAVGNKRIQLLDTNVTGTLYLEITSTVMGLETPPVIKNFAAYTACPTGA